MEKLGRRRGGGRGEIVHLCKLNSQTATRGITGNAASIDAATDDKQVNYVVVVTLIQLRLPSYMSDVASQVAR